MVLCLHRQLPSMMDLRLPPLLLQLFVLLLLPLVPVDKGSCREKLPQSSSEWFSMILPFQSHPDSLSAYSYSFHFLFLCLSFARRSRPTSTPSLSVAFCYYSFPTPSLRHSLSSLWPKHLEIFCSSSLPCDTFSTFSLVIFFPQLPCKLLSD